MSNLDWGPLNKYIDDKFSDIFNAVGEESVQSAKGDVIVESGELQNSITYESDSTHVRIEANKNYAIYVEYLYKPFLRPLLSKFMGMMRKNG